MSVAPPQRFRGIFRQDADARGVYSESAGIQRIEPVAVAVPADADDLSALVEWARLEGANLIPRGSGSSMSGGAIGSGVIVDLSRWNEIDASRLDEGRLVVGPGVVCQAAGLAARSAGLRLPVEPSSSAFCTVGGMTATNAAGASTLAFGSMRDWVEGIECLFSHGPRRWIRRGEPAEAETPVGDLAALLASSVLRDSFAAARHDGVRKDSSGYGTAAFAKSGDGVDLLVGSEGTLAFFTQIELRLAPLAGATVSVMGAFTSLGAATEAAIRAREAGAVACELLDKTFLDFVAASSGRIVDPATEALLLADAEGVSADEAYAVASAIAVGFSRAGAGATRIATDAAERDALWSLRHAASPILATLSDRLKSMQFIEDGAVPPDRLGEYVTGVRKALDGQRVRGVIFGHAGDAHVHVNPLIDVHDPDWRRKVDALLEEVTALVASLGGTLSGEHGDGRIRTGLLDRVWSHDSLTAFETVKSAFDAQGLLNPGVKTRPLTDRIPIKYDPTLAPLSPHASRALAVVERSRAYATSRLDLLTSS